MKRFVYFLNACDERLFVSKNGKRSTAALLRSRLGSGRNELSRDQGQDGFWCDKKDKNTFILDNSIMIYFGN